MLDKLGSIMSSIFRGSYTIDELMNIDSGRQERASQCNVKLVKIYHELKKETLLDKFRSFFSGDTIIMYHVIFKLNVSSPGSSSGHTVIIRLNPDFDLQDWGNNRIQVYCDCPDFKYRSAYTLGRHKSLFLNEKISIYLGEALTTPPKGKTKTTLLCKHAYAGIKWILDNYESLMRTI